MPSAFLLAEIEEILRTIPPLATRRHDTRENHAWMGRTANAILQWDREKRSAFEEFNRQFHGRNAQEANDAFEQIIVLLQQAKSDLEIQERVARLEEFAGELRALDEIILKSSNKEVPLQVSGQLIRLFNQIRDAFPELGIAVFDAHGQAVVLRAQLSTAIQKLTGHLQLTTQPSSTVLKRPTNPDLVFVIHGRQLLDEFHTFLRAIGLKPLEWQEARRRTGKPNPYVWEIVDLALHDAGCIVALLTPDDEARLARRLWTQQENALEKERLMQPRQNVLFEAGVAYGRAHDRTVLRRIGSQRPMSDLAGHHILQLDDSPQSRQAVADALRTAGCPVDLSGSAWFRAGRFSVPDGPEATGEGDGDIAGEPCGDRETIALRMLIRITATGLGYRCSTRPGQTSDMSGTTSTRRCSDMPGISIF